LRTTGIHCVVAMHSSAPTILWAYSVTVLVPEFVRLRGPPKRLETDRFAGILGSGETRTRTGDTTIFSRASSTCECARFAAELPARVTSPYSRGFPHFRCDCGPVRHTIANLCLNDYRLA